MRNKLYYREAIKHYTDALALAGNAIDQAAQQRAAAAASPSSSPSSSPPAPDDGAAGETERKSEEAEAAAGGGASEADEAASLALPPPPPKIKTPVALDCGPRMRQLQSVIYSNRAACNLALRNHGLVKQDCRLCLELDPKNVKACYRLAKVTRKFASRAPACLCARVFVYARWARCVVSNHHHHHHQTSARRNSRSRFPSRRVSPPSPLARHRRRRHRAPPDASRSLSHGTKQVSHEGRTIEMAPPFLPSLFCFLFPLSSFLFPLSSFLFHLSFSPFRRFLCVSPSPPARPRRRVSR